MTLESGRALSIKTGCCCADTLRAEPTLLAKRPQAQEGPSGRVSEPCHVSRARVRRAVQVTRVALIGRARPLARPMADSDDEVLELDLPPVESIIRLSDGRLGHVQSHTPSGTHMLVSDENGDESLLTADDGWTLEDLRVEQRS